MELLGSHENIGEHVRAWQEDMHFFVQMEFCTMNLTQYIQTLDADAAMAVAKGDEALLAFTSTSLSSLSSPLPYCTTSRYNWPALCTACILVS